MRIIFKYSNVNVVGVACIVPSLKNIMFGHRNVIDRPMTPLASSFLGGRQKNFSKPKLHIPFVSFRSCGRIFCADCSENSTPLPSEQLYNPVRVCTTCYSKLKPADRAETPPQPPPDPCKRSIAQPSAANNNPQIAASSN